MSRSKPTDNDRAGDIAVVGMACRYPGAEDYQQLIDNLLDGVCSISEVSGPRWIADDFHSLDVDEANRAPTRWLGQLDDIDLFDSAFFHISPREASVMDPQQRLLLEEAWHCIEDGGIPLSDLQRGRTAVYVGTMNQDYRLRALDADIDSYTASGTYASLLANRLSYYFGLSGPSLAIDTACAASLSALHEARRALERGDCDYAIAAGVCLFLHPAKLVSLAKSRICSPTGTVRTFDAGADGTVFGEGVGVVLLRRAADAARSGDHVHGVIRGSASNHVGRARSITAPRVESQRDLIVLAIEDAGLDPRTVTYVEAHGTGTALGDPIELEALSRAYRAYTGDSGYCTIGSIKPNIGHTDSAAGLAGFIKVLSMMQRRAIPPSIHLETANPLIDLDTSPFRTITEAQTWRPASDDLPLRAGVSAYGMGGSGAHVVVESHRPAPRPVHEPELGLPLVLSARTERSLDGAIETWRALGSSRDTDSLRDVCATLATGRGSFEHRLGGWIEPGRSLADALASAERGVAGDGAWTLAIDGASPRCPAPSASISMPRDGPRTGRACFAWSRLSPTQTLWSRWDSLRRASAGHAPGSGFRWS
jgi:polyketide synthase PksN